MVHSDGPQCADTTVVAAREVTAGQRFLIGDASLGWNPVAGAVPKPSTWAMMILGFAGIDFGGYRQSHKRVAQRAS
jgi:hypothetical protein